MTMIEQYVGNRSIEIKTTANPKAEDLLSLRREVQNTAELREVFVNHPKEEWFELITARAPEASSEAISYLVDEYDQLGTAGVQVIDPDTGKTLVVLTDEDFYSPGEASRDSGSTAQMALQVRPELQGSLYMFLHDRERERAIATRLEQRALALGFGEATTHIATRSGRKQIVQDIDPKGNFSADFVFHAVGGPAKEFLNLFREETFFGGLREIKTEVSATYKRGIQDLTATNLSYDVRGNLKASINTNLVREISRALMTKDLGVGIRLPEARYNPTLWIAPPEEVATIKRISASNILIVEGLQGILAVISKTLGHIRIDNYSIRGAEGFDRWEVRASAAVTMWVDFDRVVKYESTSTETTTVLL